MQAPLHCCILFCQLSQAQTSEYVGFFKWKKMWDSLKWNMAERVYLYPSPLTETLQPQLSPILIRETTTFSHLSLQASSLVTERSGSEILKPRVILLSLYIPKGEFQKSFTCCLTLPSFLVSIPGSFFKICPNNLFTP